MVLLREGRRRLFPLLVGRLTGCSRTRSVGCESGNNLLDLRIPDPIQSEAAAGFGGAFARKFYSCSDDLVLRAAGIGSQSLSVRPALPVSTSFPTTVPLVYGDFLRVLSPQSCGISTTSLRQAEEVGAEEPVRSPLSQAPGPVGTGKARLGVSDDRKTQAVLTGIRQSPQKLNLVAEMVRGMRVEDALTQMSVTVKRAAKFVYKVVHSAQANAVHNFGMNKDRLVVSEAFVGKDRYLKRIMPHGKGKSGRLEHARVRLTVVVKEMSLEQEADLARLRLLKRKGTRMTRSQERLVPHRVLATQWNRQRTPVSDSARNEQDS